MRRLGWKDFKIPLGLVLLCLIPLLGGVVRIQSLAGGGDVTPENARFFAAPLPILIHIIASTFYGFLGAFQFSKGFRVAWPQWHRRAGRFLFVCGLLVGFTGLWMTLTYEVPEALQGPLLYWTRLAVGTGMLVSLVLAIRCILRRDVNGHESWMIRAYALGLGAGTQAVLIGPCIVVFGSVTGLTRDVMMLLTWVINLGIAEWIVRRRGRPRPTPVVLESAR